MYQFRSASAVIFRPMHGIALCSYCLVALPPQFVLLKRAMTVSTHVASLPEIRAQKNCHADWHNLLRTMLCV